MMLTDTACGTLLPIVKTEPTSGPQPHHCNGIGGPGSRMDDVDTIAEDSESSSEKVAMNVECLNEPDSKLHESLDTTGKITSDEKYAPEKSVCCLCGICFEDKNELTLHMLDTHKQKGKQSNEVAGAAVDDNRYTCTICLAKFKTFKSYANHTNVHTNKRNRQNFETTAFSVMQKFSLQDYIQATYGDVSQQLQAVFVCQFCGTTFTSRDSYAMHMMMRVKDDTCRGPYRDSGQTLSSKFKAFMKEQKDAKTSRMETEPSNSNHGSDESFQQTYFEDVTGKADEDEYLQSLVGKIMSSDNKYKNTTNPRGDVVPTTATSKVCMFCDHVSADQDSLAMHVMSVHSQDVRFKKSDGPPTPIPTHTTDATGYTGLKSKSPDESPYEILSCSQCGEAFACRDSLAMHVLVHERSEETDKTLDKVHIPTVVDLSKKRTNSGDTENGSVKRLKYGLINGPLESVIDQNAIGANMHVRSIDTNQITSGHAMFKQPQFSCHICCEAFEHDNELRWHYKYRHTQYIEQPLCLKVVTNNSQYADSDKNHPFQSIPMDVPQRRSRSLSGDRIPTLMSPKRPFSAGQIDQLGFGRVPLKEEFVYFNEQTNKTLQRQGIGVKHNVVDSGVGTKKETENYNCGEKDSVEEIGLNLSGNPDISGTRGLPEVRIASPEMSIIYDQNQPRSIAADTWRNVEDPANLNKSESEAFQTFLKRRSDAMICKFCEIIFFNKTVYHLHMGLHNVNNPWQCNICGMVCSGVHDFSAHVIHC